jgi:hypothetical protein
VSSLGAPGSGKTTASVTACADATAAATCAQIRESVYGSPLAECLPVAGTLPDGSSCFSNWQCQSARCSLDATRSDGCGRCRTPKKTGEACTSPADCSFGSTCSSAKQCVTLGILGSACDATHPCNGAHTCSGGTCKEYPATPGAACDPSSNCDFVSAGLSCNSLKKQCTKEVENPPGKPCGWNSTTGDYQYCGRGGVCSGTTCVAKVGAGAACDSSKSLYCDVPYQCLGGVCKAFDPSVCKFF